MLWGQAGIKMKMFRKKISRIRTGGPRASECADAYNLTKAILDQIAEAFGLKQVLEQS